MNVHLKFPLAGAVPCPAPTSPPTTSLCRPPPGSPAGRTSPSPTPPRPGSGPWHIGPLAGLLAGPPEPPLEDLAIVLGVISDIELPLDSAGDAGGGPEGVRPAVGLGPLEEELFEAGEVGGREAGGGSGLGLGREPVSRLVGLDPAGDGIRADAGRGGDGFAGVPVRDGLAGPLAAALEFGGGSVGRRI